MEEIVVGVFFSFNYTPVISLKTEENHGRHQSECRKNTRHSLFCQFGRLVRVSLNFSLLIFDYG